MNYECHRTIEAVVQGGCTEIRLHPSQCTEGTFRAVADITRIILTKDMTSGLMDKIFLFYMPSPCLKLC